MTRLDPTNGGGQEMKKMQQMWLHSIRINERETKKMQQMWLHSISMNERDSYLGTLSRCCLSKKRIPRLLIGPMIWVGSACLRNDVRGWQNKSTRLKKVLRQKTTNGKQILTLLHPRLKNIFVRLHGWNGV
ncbi:unnamed protein product [Thlaspi arvense]|uniref:Uncharacterized protein n=1 Tax=Thlaspi arvense TaxID=13288 RepID=A0AAU9R783_THLAR|nr:unnamed protein product [Thlaspi arvense]